MFTKTFTSKLAGLRFFFPLGNLLMYNRNHNSNQLPSVTPPKLFPQWEPREKSLV